ncbi:MAG: heparinase II/III family protein [Hyphomicrobium aestuarii]|nr:heparinase II/III family protein [Hyphomicrobium aestuarii]
MSERFRVAAARARRVRRVTAASVLGSPLLRWRYGQLAKRSLAISPQDIRTRDRLFYTEIESGFFGLAGSVARIGSGSPFDCQPPSAAWVRELHGFSWLRHIDPVQEPAAGAWARKIVLDWLSPSRPHAAVARLPEVRARRIISWLSSATVLLDADEPAAFDEIMKGIAADVTTLSAQWRLASDGKARLTALTALVFARVVFEDEDEHLETVLAMLIAEIERQVLPDGGHISRNPAALIDVLLDWLPLKSCFDARGLEVPQPLRAAIERAVGMVRFLRLGDGGIARFNGMGVADRSTIATLLAYDAKPVPDLVLAAWSRYARLERSGTIVIADAGVPPPLEVSGEACAGCLSFEASAGTNLLFVNMGAPSPADGDWRAMSRATASHTAACLSEVSSAQLVRDARLEAASQAIPLTLAGRVQASVQVVDDGVAIEMSHEGYFGRNGLIHRRLIGVDANGSIAGADHFEPRHRGSGADEVPFSIHFHLHPSTTIEPSSQVMTGRSANLVLRLQDGSSWRFEIIGAAASIEESTFLASSSGPQPSLRIVARGIATGATTVEWSVGLDS